MASVGKFEEQLELTPRWRECELLQPLWEACVRSAPLGYILLSDPHFLSKACVCVFSKRCDGNCS